jgi:hypothetical protein
MKAALIEDGWQQFVRSTFPNGFCCDAHRDLYRAIYFTGAMAAMHTLTGWDPDRPGALTIVVPNIAAVNAELTTIYHEEQAVAAGQAGARH